MAETTETITRTVGASPERVWELWTTAGGIEQWWAPAGFTTEVQRLDLKEGGELVYTMTATAPEAIAFMEQNGMPLTTESRKTFTEIQDPTRLAYTSLVDFVPDHDPYDHLTIVDLEPVDEGTKITMTVEPMHDPDWTGRVIEGRANEIDNLARLVSGS
jgi:uncharacterized protein YndB with AHSA1/START domain